MKAAADSVLVYGSKPMTTIPQRSTIVRRLMTISAANGTRLQAPRAGGDDYRRRLEAGWLHRMTKE